MVLMICIFSLLEIKLLVTTKFNMVKKKIDNRIRILIENGMVVGHRTLVVLVGDKSRDQVSFNVSLSWCCYLMLVFYHIFT